MQNIISVNQLLTIKQLNIPEYQRPYQWTTKNVQDLLEDIETAIEDSKKYDNFKYRIGSIILNEEPNTIDEDKKINIVDGQQRIITLTLLAKFLKVISKDDSGILNINFDNDITQTNIYYNYKFIEDWFRLKDDSYQKQLCEAMKNTLEVVVLKVDRLSEAFQLFDSQNTRGKALYPQDLLKAYHLRVMEKNIYDEDSDETNTEIKKVVEDWESVDPKKIKELFDSYLFPISKWTKRQDSIPFTAQEIAEYKGIPQDSEYTYKKIAEQARPYFQLTESFVEGEDYFKMVSHYLDLKEKIEAEIEENDKFEKIRNKLKEKNGAGFEYTKKLFKCALLCYYDKFNNFDEKAVKKLFTWAFMLRVDKQRVGYDSINKYAKGEIDASYTNTIPMFYLIKEARLHTQIENIQLIVEMDKNIENKWQGLYEILKEGV